MKTKLVTVESLQYIRRVVVKFYPVELHGGASAAEGLIALACYKFPIQGKRLSCCTKFKGTHS